MPRYFVIHRDEALLRKLYSAEAIGHTSIIESSCPQHITRLQMCVRLSRMCMSIHKQQIRPTVRGIAPALAHGSASWAYYTAAQYILRHSAGLHGSENRSMHSLRLERDFHFAKIQRKKFSNRHTKSERRPKRCQADYREWKRNPGKSHPVQNHAG